MNTPPRRFLTLGDSYTIGVGVPKRKSWPFQLSNRIQKQGISILDPVVIAEQGWTSLTLIQALQQRSPSGTFDLVSLQIGVNDQYDGINPDIYQDNFQSLLDQTIQFAGGSAQNVVVLSIPDWSVTLFAEESSRDEIREEINHFNLVNKTETIDKGVLYLDITPLSREATHNPEFVAEDGLHPSEAMYCAWVDLILPAILAVLIS